MKDEKIVETPLMKQYFSVKAQYPEAVLLFRVGDFYETFADDALITSKVLGIVLTKRANGSASSVPLAGFPHHSIDIYLPRLVRAGYKVAVCDQLEDPKLTKKIVKRGVTELVTPGIAFSDQLLEQKEHNYLAGLTFDKDRCGAAFLDVSTGTFQVAEGTIDYIATLLSSFAPKELLVPRGYAKGVKDRFGDSYYVSTLEEWAFVYDSAVEKLRKQLGVDSLKGFAIDMYPLGVTSAGALLVYLEQTQHTGLKHICSISRIDENRFVWMDRFTFRNLEIFSSTVGKDGVALVDVMDRCSSPMGARLLRTWLSMPVMDLSELNARYDVVERFAGDGETLRRLQEHIGDMGDLERIISRAAAGKISPREVMQLARGLDQMAPIASLCKDSGVAAIDDMISHLDGCTGLLETLKKTMHSDPAAAIGKGQVIASGVDRELDELRDIMHGGKGYLANLEAKLREETGIPKLKIGFNKVFGYYIEVSRSYTDSVPDSFTRKQTLTTGERYITPELKELENKILGANERLLVLEHQLFADLLAEISAQVVRIQRTALAVAQLDVLAGFAEVALQNNYVLPVVDQSGVMEIKEGRHPVIEQMLKGTLFVPNDTLLDEAENRMLLITGPNMAGKSTYMRQNALIALMAQIGCFVPASSAHIGVVDAIFTRVGASDDLAAGQSTFMVEMTEVAEILRHASKNSLVILDEIGRGTSTFDGMSIARAVVEYICDNIGCKTLFATHYHELTSMDKDIYGVKNYNIAVKKRGEDITFLRRIVAGPADDSYGIEVAKLAGLPSSVTKRAHAVLRQLEASAPGHNQSMQLDFETVEAYNNPTVPSEVVDKLRSIDIETLTPLEALNFLYELKNALDKN